MRSHALAGFGTNLRLALRRDRFTLPGAFLGSAFLLGMTSASFVSLYPDVEDRQGMALTIDNPGSTFLLGRVYHAQDYTWGVMTGHQEMVFSAIAAALVCGFLAVRHTRTEEETGRADLIAAAPVGRFVTLATAAVQVLLLALCVTVTMTVALVAQGQEAVDLAGALTFALAACSVGLAFGGVGAVAAQVTTSARAARGIVGMAVAVAFVVRGIADTSTDAAWMAWLSPIGWAQKSHPWDTDDLAPVALCAGVAIGLFAVAAWLNRGRDVGAGAFASRPGRRTATRALTTPSGLAGRLSRASIVGWTVGFVGFALAYGPVLGDAEDFLTQTPVLAELLPSAADAGGIGLFAAVVIALGSIVLAIPAVGPISRLVKDETSGRTVALLANGVSRLGWYVRTLLLALATALGIGVLFGIALGATAVRVAGIDSLFADIVVGVVGYVGAIAVVLGLGGFLAGWVPRLFGIVWGFVAFTVVVFYFADLMDWPTWVSNISPFTHVTARPGETSSDATAQVVLWVAAVALGALGAVGYRRRDVAGH